MAGGRRYGVTGDVRNPGRFQEDVDKELAKIGRDMTAAEAAAVPVGAVTPYAGAAAPARWLFCFGQNVSRMTYAALFAALGTTHGAGDGSTTFALPDLRGRAVFGKDNMGGAAASRVTNAVSGITGTTLGAAGGDQTLHQHTHTATSTFTTPAAGSDQILQRDTGAPTLASPAAGAVYSQGLPTVTTTVANAGAGASQNMPPTLVLNYIIYAGA